MKSVITDVQIKHWMRAGHPLAKAQGEVPGLTFTLSKNGTAAWILRYRLAGVKNQKEYTIGRYPEISIKDAKTEALRLRGLVQKGIDVGRQKRQATLTRAQEQSLKALALDYESKVLAGLSPATQKAGRFAIHGWIVPKLGAIPAREVNAADVVRLIEHAGDGSHSRALRVYGVLSKVLDHGVGKNILDANPCRLIKLSAVLGKAPDKRSRVMLTEEELRAILPALNGHMSERSAIAVRLLLITAVRISELLQAEWRHVDLERAEWTIPAEHTKTRQGFVVPLPHQAVALFRRLHGLACGSDYVLPGRDRGTCDPSTIKRAIEALLEQLPDVRPFTPHDLRSTCRSHLAALGVSVVVAERCLNHRLGGMVQKYDKHDYLEERRIALSNWVDFLEACESGQTWRQSGNVVPLHAKR